MMIPEQTALYQRLQAFELDDQTHEFGFTRHLMKSHGWSVDYARRAIEEYKKFTFLTVVSDYQVVPSDAVDQVWHAHILLTESYWEEFCPQVLRKNLHHHPARGGKEERATFHQLYLQTIKTYCQFFGEPPVEIWSPSYVRFGSELRQQRVNLSEHWLIPKPSLNFIFNRLSNVKFLTPLIAFIGVSFTITGCTSSQIGLSFFLASSIAFFMIVKLIRYFIRFPEKQPIIPKLDHYELAYLAGGKTRAAELAIVRLVNYGYLMPNIRHKTLSIVKPLPSSALLIEQKVMQNAKQSPTLDGLRQSTEQHTTFLAERLQQKKLLMQGIPAELTNFCFVIILVGCIPLLILFSSWATSLAVFLVKFWMFSIVVGLCLYMPSQRTVWGDRILKQVKEARDVHCLIEDFALSGYTVLSGGELDDLRQIFDKTLEEKGAGCGCGC